MYTVQDELKQSFRSILWGFEATRLARCHILFCVSTSTVIVRTHLEAYPLEEADNCWRMNWSYSAQVAVVVDVDVDVAVGVPLQG